MKFFVAFAALVAVAAASSIHKPAVSAAAELEAIIAAINSPSTDPATASLLEQQLEAILAGANPEPIAVGPAIVDSPTYEPISVGPAIVDTPTYEPISVGPAIVGFPLPDGGAVSAPVDVAPVVVGPSPVVVGPIAPGAPSPLVQIILNINQAVSPAPAGVATPAEIVPTPVQVVDFAPEIPAEPVQVVDAAPTPITVVEAAPTPITVVEAAPVPVEPVLIGTPIIPAPAVTLPEELN